MLLLIVVCTGVSVNEKQNNNQQLYRQTNVTSLIMTQHSFWELFAASTGEIYLLESSECMAAVDIKSADTQLPVRRILSIVWSLPETKVSKAR